MVVNQIYNLLNSASKEAYGQAAMTVKDTSGFIALGAKVLRSDVDKEAFYNAINDVIAKTIVAEREHKKKDRKVKRNAIDFGAGVRKISFITDMDNAAGEFRENGAWDFTTQVSPFDVEKNTKAVCNIYSVMGTYTYEDSLPDDQLKSAFINEASMAAFISGIYMKKRNHLIDAENELAALTVATNIAMVWADPNAKATQKRNLLGEFNTKTGAGLTVESCMRNADFLKYATREINRVRKQMAEPGIIFNTSTNIVRTTPADKLVVEVLADFASATTSYLEADTYHKELVALDGYEEVAYWQAPGTDFSFDNVSKVMIQHPNGATIEIDNVIAFLHDEDSCASMIDRPHDWSMYNPRARRNNIGSSAEKGSYVDVTENAVIFYLAA